MKALILHNIEDFGAARQSALDNLLCFERYGVDLQALYFNITHPIPELLKQEHFDLVIFDSTALGIVTFRPDSLFFEVWARWRFLNDRPAVKLVFPQDDYNHSSYRDDWFVDLNVSAIYTPLHAYRNLFYPKSSKQCDIFPVLTGYVEERRFAERRRFAKPFGNRNRLIGQRVTLYPARGGRYSRIKGLTAEIVKREAERRKLVVDISVEPKDSFEAEAWFEFLGDCKFVLGAEGGVSLWDLRGEIEERIIGFTAANPESTFEEIEAACFPNEDGRYKFSAISPRLFEAAACGCCQILVKGDYLGILKPYEHYIPLNADGSNLDEVFDLVRDEAAAIARAESTYEALIKPPEFRHEHLVNQVLDYARRKLPSNPAISVTTAELRATHRLPLLQQLVEHERSIGFAGPALVDRVVEHAIQQYASPLSIADKRPAQLLHAVEAFTRAFVETNALNLESYSHGDEFRNPAFSHLSRLRQEAAETISVISRALIDVAEIEIELLRDRQSIVPLSWFDDRREDVICSSDQSP